MCCRFDSGACSAAASRGAGGGERGAGGARNANKNAAQRGGGDDGGGVYGSFQHLHAISTPFAHDNAPLAINSNAARVGKLAVAAAAGADGSNMRAIAVPQHLHAMIVVIGHEDAPRPVKGKA